MSYARDTRNDSQRSHHLVHRRPAWPARSIAASHKGPRVLGAGQPAERAGEQGVLGPLCAIGQDDWCRREGAGWEWAYGG